MGSGINHLKKQPKSYLYYFLKKNIFIRRKSNQLEKLKNLFYLEQKFTNMLQIRASSCQHTLIG